MKGLGSVVVRSRVEILCFFEIAYLKVSMMRSALVTFSKGSLDGSLVSFLLEEGSFVGHLM